MRHKVKLNSVAMQVSTIRKVIRHQMAVVSGILSEYVDTSRSSFGDEATSLTSDY